MNGKCCHCHRWTDQRCNQCRFYCCPQHTWTQVYKEKLLINMKIGDYNEYTGEAIVSKPNRYTLAELCRTCRDAALVGAVS